MLHRQQRAVAEPLGDHEGGQGLGPVGGAAGAHVVEEARPELVARAGVVEERPKDRSQLGRHRHDAHRGAVMDVGILAVEHGQSRSLPCSRPTF